VLREKTFQICERLLENSLYFRGKWRRKYSEKHLGDEIDCILVDDEEEKESPTQFHDTGSLSSYDKNKQHFPFLYRLPLHPIKVYLRAI
jgi:hypothetical protein